MSNAGGGDGHLGVVVWGSGRQGPAGGGELSAVLSSLCAQRHSGTVAGTSAHVGRPSGPPAKLTWSPWAGLVEGEAPCGSSHPAAPEGEQTGGGSLRKGVRCPQREGPSTPRPGPRTLRGGGQMASAFQRPPLTPVLTGLACTRAGTAFGLHNCGLQKGMFFSAWHPISAALWEGAGRRTTREPLVRGRESPRVVLGESPSPGWLRSTQRE